MKRPRVAFFPDSFHETNGVALTSREFTDFAKRNGLPFLSVRAGAETASWQDGSLSILELRNGDWKVPLESDLFFDVLFARHCKRVLRALREFKPDIVHITGPAHIGVLGVIAAYHLKIPVAASWHTNLHEFGAERLIRAFEWLPTKIRGLLKLAFESLALQGLLLFYRLGKIVFAPNPELLSMLAEGTGRHCRMMLRGIYADRFTPAARDRSDGVFTVGYVGRLSAEKNLEFFAQLEQGFVNAGLKQFRIRLIGDGGHRSWLESHLGQVEFAGVQRGEALAREYANLDLFVFPSRTDTFGNVVLEAQASGVPVLVTHQGGPKFVVRHGITGLTCESDEEMVHAALLLAFDPNRRAAMAAAARNHAMQFSWNEVFSAVYQGYEALLGSVSAYLQSSSTSSVSGVKTLRRMEG